MLFLIAVACGCIIAKISETILQGNVLVTKFDGFFLYYLESYFDNTTRNCPFTDINSALSPFPMITKQVILKVTVNVTRLRSIF